MNGILAILFESNIDQLRPFVPVYLPMFSSSACSRLDAEAVQLYY